MELGGEKDRFWVEQTRNESEYYFIILMIFLMIAILMLISLFSISLGSLSSSLSSISSETIIMNPLFHSSHASEEYYLFLYRQIKIRF